jgi:sugar lactone lactonase YvrE
MKKIVLLVFFAMPFISACRHSGPVVSTYAGNGSLGAVNGKAGEASFSNLMAVAADSAGNLYVADSRNNMIRKVSADGIVTTLAGSGKVGAEDGKGSAASFFFPTALTVDQHGVVYVADTHNNMIRKITPDGQVSTIAGRLNAQTENHPAALSRFDNPYGIAVDKNGNVFVADWDKDEIKKIDTAGKVTLFAGSGNPGSRDGVGAASSFYLPEGIAFDQKGNLFVADTYNNRIRKITPAGVVSTLIAGKVVPQQGRTKRDTSVLSHPFGIAVDKSGNIYVGDVGNNKIRKITPAGKMVTFAGTGLRGAANGAANKASFYNPYGVAADNKGNLFVADYQNNIIRKISF